MTAISQATAIDGYRWLKNDIIRGIYQPDEKLRMSLLTSRYALGVGPLREALSQLVAERLEAPVVHMDDIYPGWDGLAAALPVLADEVLIPLRSGEPGVFRRWDWAAGEHGGELEVPVAPFVVVEGCGSGVGPAGQLADLRVWLDADAEQRRARGLTRDAGSFDEQWDSWAQQEDELFEADETREHADLVFDTTEIAATD